MPSEKNSEASDIWLGFMTEAHSLAHQAAVEGEVPVGALIVKDGRVIGRGYNRRETLQDPISHAEIHALQEAARAEKSWRLTGCTLVVTLEPCPMCLGAAQQARVDRVVYGAPDSKGGAISLGYKLNEDQRFNHRFKVGCLPHPPSSKILSDFFKKMRKS